MLKWFFVSFAALALLTRASLSQTMGSVSGTVMDQAGKPINGIWVTAVRTALPPASGAATSDATGLFLIQNLPAGPYKICAQSPSWQYLDPCFWTDPVAGAAFPASIIASKTTTVPVKLQSAAKLQIRVNDPQQLLGPAHPERDVAVDVLTPARVYFRARLASQDPAGRTMEVPIPSDRELRVLVTPTQVSLVDATNTAVPGAGTIMAVTHPGAATAPALVTFTVSAAQ
ncbi:exported hypothetical protein [Candidatus Sulfopaludibacter sp. SbA4]|nr:exported hypothetical protein [Candidatus Sulfopaludibacter sp. SbA4]